MTTTTTQAQVAEVRELLADAERRATDARVAGTVDTLAEAQVDTLRATLDAGLRRLAEERDAAEAHLFVHDGGRVACPKPRCLGSAASSALEANPNARLLTTTLGTWERVTVTVADAAEFGLACETCE